MISSFAKDTARGGQGVAIKRVTFRHSFLSLPIPWRATGRGKKTTDNLSTVSFAREQQTTLCRLLKTPRWNAPDVRCNWRIASCIIHRRYGRERWRNHFANVRKGAYLRIHPETMQHVAGGKARQGTASEIISFAKDTAEKTGVSERTVQHDVQIGEKIAAQCSLSRRHKRHARPAAPDAGASVAAFMVS